MSDDANPPNETDSPKVHTATLSEPKASSEGAKPSKPKKNKKTKPEPTTPLGKLWHNWVKPIGSVILIVVAFRSMLLDWNDVPSGSMEPEIHVGDRIAVNRLAYGLQFPLTGPQIGIPFTPIQFDNPLDGIPQIQWGSGPQRGDIVTFWNPVADTRGINVRMVKRIVAIPGDTIEIRGGEMTINGEAASYTELDAIAEDLPIKTKYGKGTQRTLTYRLESLDDQTRIVQHINKRWITEGQIIELPNGERVTIAEGKIIENLEPGTDLATVLQRNGYPLSDTRILAEIKDAAIFIDGQNVDYNTLAATLLDKHTSDGTAEILKKAGMSIDGHKLMIEGKQTHLAFFDQQFSQLSEADRNDIGSFLNTLNVLRHASLNNFGPYTVPEDSYLMIGDNRNNSSDGRYFGPVKRSEITGHAFAVAFSFEDNKMFALPPDPAWGRFFKDLD